MTESGKRTRLQISFENFISPVGARPILSVAKVQDANSIKAGFNMSEISSIRLCTLDDFETFLVSFHLDRGRKDFLLVEPQGDPLGEDVRRFQSVQKHFLSD